MVCGRLGYPGPGVAPVKAPARLRESELAGWALTGVAGPGRVIEAARRPARSRVVGNCCNDRGLAIRRPRDEGIGGGVDGVVAGQVVAGQVGTQYGSGEGAGLVAVEHAGGGEVDAADDAAVDADLPDLVEPVDRTPRCGPGGGGRRPTSW